MISDKDAGSYTVTTNGSCSADCGDGNKTIVTLSCHITTVSKLECDKSITSEWCNLKDCPSKIFWYSDKCRIARIYKVAFRSLVVYL